jgi:hypothetical protein
VDHPTEHDGTANWPNQEYSIYAVQCRLTTKKKKPATLFRYSKTCPPPSACGCRVASLSFFFCFLRFESRLLTARSNPPCVVVCVQCSAAQLCSRVWPHHQHLDLDFERAPFAAEEVAGFFLPCPPSPSPSPVDARESFNNLICFGSVPITNDSS